MTRCSRQDQTKPRPPRVCAANGLAVRPHPRSCDTALLKPMSLRRSPCDLEEDNAAKIMLSEVLAFHGKDALSPWKGRSPTPPRSSAAAAEYARTWTAAAASTYGSGDGGFGALLLVPSPRICHRRCRDRRSRRCADQSAAALFPLSFFIVLSDVRPRTLALPFVS
jgi:hypothetical protein